MRPLNEDAYSPSDFLLDSGDTEMGVEGSNVPLTDAALKYIKERGISEATAKEAGLISGTHYFRKVGETDAIGFPYFQIGNRHPASVKWRSVVERAFSHQGPADIFWGLHLIPEGFGTLHHQAEGGYENHQAAGGYENIIFITEGEFDALSLREAGFTSTLSVPSGSPNKLTKDDNLKSLPYLWDARSILRSADKVYICTDMDGPGEVLAEELARRIGRAKCYRVNLPHKDVNETLIKEGAEALRTAVDCAEPWPVAGVYGPETFFNQVTSLYERGRGSGVSTGFNNLDQCYTVAPGQITVVTGVPNSGKSEFLDQIMVNMAIRKDWRFAIWSAENPPADHIIKLIEKASGKPFFLSRSRLSELELGEHMMWVSKYFSFIESIEDTTIGSILEKAEAAVLRNGANGLIIDPYNYITRPSDVSETEFVSDLLTQVRAFAQARDVHVWIVAHPHKLYRDGGRVPVPTGYDISGSSHWFNKCDCGFTVHREEECVKAVVWKVRFKWVGQQGEAVFTYDRMNGQYKETNDIEIWATQ